MKLKSKQKMLGKCAVALLLVPVVASGIFVGSFSASANIGSTLDPDKKYLTDYDSFTETEEAAAELNLELMAEGAVLLKNDGLLPISTSATSKAKVTVLGAQADTLSTGGGGSGAQLKPGYDETPDEPYTLFDSLDAANIEYNPSVKERYEAPDLDPGTLSNGTPYESGHYMTKVDSSTGNSVSFAGNYYVPVNDGTGSLDGVSLTGYDETAIIVLTRTGSEGSDNLSYDLPNMDDPTDHAMSLDKGEKELIAYAKANFDNIVVILNSPSVMEVGDLQNDDAISAILCIGQPGWNGIMSVGKILNGEVNPSGRTVDFWMSDFATDPTWYNSGNYMQANAIINGDTQLDSLNSSSTVTMGYDPAYAIEGVVDGNYHLMDYAEGIYMGYRYYETVYTELEAEAGKDIADEWYASATIYPFGYGLSYTTFSQQITDINGDLSDADGDITVTVRVTNTGDVAGKEVVQLYSTPPYTEGGIEKASANLVGFEKTSLLQPGTSEEVEVTIAVKDLASFDYNDANTNENSGYELETGSYVLSVRNNSHDILDSETLNAQTLLTWDEDGDPSTPNNIFSQEDGAWEMYNTLATHWSVDGAGGYLSRTDLITGSGSNAIVALEAEYTLGNPNALQEQLGWLIANGGYDNLFKAEAFNVLNSQATEYAYEDYDNHLTLAVESDYENVWTKSNEDIPDDWTQGTGVLDENGMYEIILSDMKGIPFDDERWTEFMNQLTWEELVSISGNEVGEDGGYGSRSIDSIAKSRIQDHDGPGQLRVVQNGGSDGNGYAWVSETVIGSTWNKELAYEQGRIIGNESLFLDVNGWYGPGANIHRGALAGRNFEYYSQDGVHAGYIMAAVVKGATDMGVHVYMKHAFLNDQETGRMGNVTFATEQAIREIYAKPFEIAIKQGNANGMMVACNRIGLASSASYGITVQMYVNEWGFDGSSISDAYIASAVATTGWDSEVMLRGLILPLNSGLASFPSATPIEGTWNTSLRDGKGGVTVNSGANDTTQMESPTQYYFARMAAQYALYTYANGNAITGFTSNMMLPDSSAVLEPSESYTGDEAVVYSQSQLDKFRSDMLDIFGSAENYEITATGVPDGMTLDMETGTITGTAPAEPGKYYITVSVNGVGGYSHVSRTVANVTVDVSANVVYGQPVNIKYNGFVELTDENYVPGGAANQAENVGKYVAVEYIVNGLPEGLTFDEDTCTITGTLTQLPEYVGQRLSFEVTQILTQVTSSSYGGETQDFVYGGIMYITVGVEGAENITYNVNIPGYGTAEILVAGDTIADIATPEAPVAGFKFRGWAATADGEILADTDAIPETLYAVWEWPAVTIVNGTFWINGEDTGISPEGQPGEPGVGIEDITFESGEDGTVVTIILTDGTTKTFTIPNGTPGADGAPGANGQDGADGTDGADGADGQDAGSGLAIAAIAISAVALLGAGAVAFLALRKKNG